MDTLKAWQKEVLQRLALELEQYGFRQKGQSFFRKCPSGRETFHVSFIPHGDDFDLTADVAIRFNDVEDLANSDSAWLSKTEKLKTHTIGTELGNLSESRQKRWSVNSEADIPSVVQSIMASFRELALPYFKDFADVNRVLEVLSSDGPASSRHSPLPEARARRAVSMALLFRDKEVAREVAARKLAVLRERKDPGLPSFCSFLEKIGLTS